MVPNEISNSYLFIFIYQTKIIYNALILRLIQKLTTLWGSINFNIVNLIVHRPSGPGSGHIWLWFSLDPNVVIRLNLKTYIFRALTNRGYNRGTLKLFIFWWYLHKAWSNEPKGCISLLRLLVINDQSANWISGLSGHDLIFYDDNENFVT